MKLQKILTLVTLIFAAITLVYSFSFNSGMLFEIQYYAVPQFDVSGANELVDGTKTVNNTMVIMSIVLIVSVVLLYFTQTNKRRNYYITNYIAIGIFTLYALAYAITFFVLISKVFALCSQVDTAKWLEYVNYEPFEGAARLYPQHYSLSKVSLILGIVVAVIAIIFAVAWVINTFIKVKLMMGEKKLLKNEAPVSGVEVKEVL